MPCIRPAWLAVAALLVVPARAQAQSPSAVGWSGWARCQVAVQGPGYSDQQTHTWTMPGGAPSVEGAFRVYAGTWTVVGSGSLQRSQGTQTLTAQWATNGPATNAPIAVFVRADGRMFIQARHAQLRAGGAIQGFQQQTIDGKALPPVTIAAEAFEWQFPVIEVPAASNTATGSTSQAVAGSVGPMQPAGSQVTASCAWQFGQAAAAPAPPPPVSPQPVPVPGAVPSIAQSPAPPPAAQAPAAPPVSQSPVPPTIAAPVPTAPSSPPSSPPTATTSPGATSPTSPAIVRPPSTPVTASPGVTGGLTAVPGAPAVTAATARDPANFTARQTGDGTVLLTWDAVAGAGSYLLGGPGANVGVTVTGTSQTLTGIPQGPQTWTVATMYAPGGILTTSDRWSRASTTVTNQSGRYRVLISGFRVNRPTFDERINGNGDEVFAAAGITAIDRRNDSVLQPWTIVKSEPHGDVGRNPGYVRAGSATPTGGLAAGDAVPAGTDPRLVSGGASATRFPLMLWEGTLRDGIDAVVVKPTLWEIDGQPFYYTEWADSGGGGRWHPQLSAEQAAAVKDKAAKGDITPFRGVIIFSCANADQLQPDCRPGDDRPIGINQDSCFGNPRALSWCDITIVVTREGVERLLSSPNEVLGVPPGLIMIRLTEPEGVDLVRGGLDGSYELFVRVERLP